MPAVAITDHGNLYGAIEFYLAAEACRNPANHRVRSLRGARFAARAQRLTGKEAAFHLTLLATDADGYRNLVKLITAAHLEGLLLQAAHRQGSAGEPLAAV